MLPILNDAYVDIDRHRRGWISIFLPEENILWLISQIKTIMNRYNFMCCPKVNLQNS